MAIPELTRAAHGSPPQGPPRPPRGPGRGDPRRRVRLLLPLVGMVVTLFAARLVQLQVLDPNSYAAAAKAENLVTVDLPAERGEILDRNGRPLAESVDGLMVTVDPSLISSDVAAGFASFLSKELGVDYFTTLTKLRKTDSRFQYVARKVPAALATEVVQKAEDEGYPPLFTERDPYREYPADDVASNLVGMMGTDGPLGGVELSFNSLLQGKDGSATYEVGAGGARLPLGDQSSTAPVNGHDLTLTLDTDLQWYAKSVLADAVAANNARNGIAIVMDSKTGEILALADVPTFSPTAPELSDSGAIGARSLSEVYEPGSVAKVFTTSTLLDTGLATPEEQLEIPSYLRLGPTTIKDAWSHGTLHLTLAGAISQSSNIGTILASQDLTAETLRAYLVKFGLGQKTNIGIYGESAGILNQDISAQDKARITFGQSVSVNALQMIAGVNAIANGGVRISPSLIKGTATTDDGQVVGTDVATSERVVSEQAATEMMNIMELVPNKVAKSAQVPGYRVAGKTGTAQRVDEECGCYNGDLTVSFAGFAPADDPQLTVYVVLNKVQGLVTGGLLAAPVFSKIMSFALRHYGVQPTNTPSSDLPSDW